MRESKTGSPSNYTNGRAEITPSSELNKPRGKIGKQRYKCKKVTKAKEKQTKPGNKH